ncbi:MAG: branched-chain amino acid ABC transporter substrate-binding protein [Candidatus Firestonebacteria bacterium]
MAIKSYFLIVGLTVSFTLLIGCAKKGETVKIGVGTALTGQESAIGQDISHAVELAIEEANAKGDLKKRIEFVAYDDKSDPKDAVTVAHRFSNNSDIIGVVGHLVSSCAIPASEIYNKNGLVMITPSATNPKLTKNSFNNVFRTCATDDVQGVAIAKFIANTLKKKKIAIIHDRQSYGQGLAEEVKKNSINLGVGILAFEGITVKEMDYSSVLTKIKSTNPEVVFFAGMYNEGSLICKQMADLGLKALYMSGDGCYNPIFIELSGKKCEGAVVSFVAPPFEEIETAEEFVKKFRKRFGEIQTYAPYAYDAANLIIEAYRQTGTSDRKTISETMKKIKNFNGVTGNIEFDEKGDRKHTKFYFYKVKNGKFQWIKE